MANNYGKGLHRSTPEAIAHRLGAHNHDRIAAALAAGPRGSASLPTCHVMNQGQSATCHAHSLAAGLWSARQAAGKPLPFVPSPLLIASCTYAEVRTAAMPVGNLPFLVDNGAQLQDDANAVSVWGVAPIIAPTSDGRFSDVENYDGPFPEADVSRLQVAGNELISGEYAINIDTTTHNVVAASLDVGVPVWAGVFVDSAFERLGPSDVAPEPNAGDPSGGGHAVLLVGYRTNAKGEFEFRLQNSWGSWCDGGFCWVSKAWLMAAWNLWPLTVVP